MTSDALAFWVKALLLGGTGFAIARRDYRRGAPILLLITMSFAAGWTDWKNGSSGGTASQMGGRLYLVHLIASTVFASGLTILGMVKSRRAP
jgi:hypothetical protein